MEKQWYVYILECGDGTFYTGVTSNVGARMKAHATGRGSKYVLRNGFKKLLRVKKCGSKSEAYKCEYVIKQLKRGEKLGWFD